MEVKILKLDHLGNGIAKNEGKVIFIKRSLIDEVVDVKVIEDKKNYQVGIINDIKVDSKNRINVICPYYDKCGGCDFLHTNKEIEIDFKKNKGIDLINSSLNFYDTKEYHYRNKVTLHVKNNKIGFYQEKTNDIIDIDYCYLLDDKINIILKKLHCYLQKNDCNIEEIMIRVDKETMMSIKGIIDHKFLNTFNFVDTIIVDNKVVKGRGFIEKEIMGYKFKISPLSFFQVNDDGLKSIFNILKNNLNNRYHKALDLYSGTSVMGILISSFCDEVISIESNQNATNDALINIKENNIKNIKVINDKVENVIDKLEDVDLIIVDPPRKGLDKKTIFYIKNIRPKTFIYISCNMITLKRDLSFLSEFYEIEEFNLVNMFPKTYHVECVCVLKLK